MGQLRGCVAHISRCALLYARGRRRPRITPGHVFTSPATMLDPEVGRVCRNLEPSCTLAVGFARSVHRFPIFTSNLQVTCCVALLLVEVGAFLRILSFFGISYEYSHAENIGPRPAADRGHSQRRRREGEGVRR